MRDSAGFRESLSMLPGPCAGDSAGLREGLSVPPGPCAGDSAVGESEENI